MTRRLDVVLDRWDALGPVGKLLGAAGLALAAGITVALIIAAELALLAWLWSVTR